jgi:hypothetical protein
MKDIVGEAILFDMYYMGKDPVPFAGEKRELPKVEFKPVDETTPVFKNFNISNVYCNGAEKGIFVRGLPEMHVQNIKFENMVLQANKGIDIQEATNLSFKNIEVISKETNPVIEVIQSDKIVFDNMKCTKNAELFFRINGERSSLIEIKNTNTTQVKQKIQFDLGANENAVIIK